VDKVNSNLVTYIADLKVYEHIFIYKPGSKLNKMIRSRTFHGCEQSENSYELNTHIEILTLKIWYSWMSIYLNHT